MGLGLRVLAAVLVAVFAMGCGSSSDGGGQPTSDAGGDVDVDSGSAGDGGGPVDSGSDAPVVPGTPVADVPAVDIDFGFSECGGAPAGQRTLIIKNTGGGTLTWSAALASTTMFFIVGPGAGTIVGGKSATLTLSALSVPPATLADTVLQTTLTVTTSDAAHAKTDVKVKATAGGGKLELSPATAAFGVVALGAQAPDVPVTLKNVGNRPVTLDFNDPADNQFAITWTGAPQAVTVAPGATVPGLAARFRPTALTPSTSSSRIVLVSGGLCGTSPTTIAMTGRGASGAFAFSPAVIDFGNVACGTTSTLPLAQRTVTITNAGGATFTFAATLGRGANSPYTITTSGSPVAAGGTGTIVVAAKTVPATSAITPNLYGDTISITTNIPNDVTHTVDVRETASGAILAFQPQIPIAFGGVPVNTSTQSGFTVANVGNAPATVTASATNGPTFTLSTTAIGMLTAGASSLDNVVFAPTTTTPATSTVSLALGVNDSRCAPLPTLAVSGTGTNGAVSLSASAIDFGLVDCGTSTGPRTLTIRNAGSTTFTWNAVLARGGNYTLGLTSTTLAPGNSGTVTVTPVAIPTASSVAADFYGDTLVVTTDIAGDTQHDVPLHMTARGAIITASDNTLAFGGVAVSTTATAPLTLANAGNVATSVTITHTAGVFVLSPSAPTVGAGSSTLVTASFTPTAAASYSDTATFSVPNGTPLCGPLPGSVALSGDGSSGAALVTPSSLDYGLVQCGTTTQDQSIVIENTGNAQFSFTASLTQGASYYSLNSAGGVVDPGQQFFLVVTPNAIPQTSLTTPDLYAGEVTITTTAPGDVAHKISLHETAQGARLQINVTSLAFGTVAVGQSATRSFTLTNSGNRNADIAYAGFQTPPFDAAPDLFTMMANSSTGVVVTFSPNQTGAVTGQQLTIDTSDPLCLPLPAPVTFSGTGQ